MVKEEKENRICSRCNSVVKDSQNKIIIKKYEGTKVIKVFYYHENCWNLNFDEEIMRRIQTGQKLALHMMGSIMHKTFESINEQKGETNPLNG